MNLFCVVYLDDNIPEAHYFTDSACGGDVSEIVPLNKTCGATEDYNFASYVTASCYTPSGNDDIFVEDDVNYNTTNVDDAFGTDDYTAFKENSTFLFDSVDIFCYYPDTQYPSSAPTVSLNPTVSPSVSPAQSPVSSDSSSSSSLSTGEIVGITLGSLFLIVLVAAALYYYFYYRKVNNPDLTSNLVGAGPQDASSSFNSNFGSGPTRVSFSDPNKKPTGATSNPILSGEIS